jgi:hypothetical protein
MMIKNIVAIVLVMVLAVAYAIILDNVEPQAESEDAVLKRIDNRGLMRVHHHYSVSFIVIVSSFFFSAKAQLTRRRIVL